MESKAIRPHIYYSAQIKKLKNNSKKYHQIVKQFLQSYKIYPCYQQSKHNLQLCHFYHDKNDYRRNPYFNHQFLYNQYDSLCDCSSPQCPKVHNQYQSYYHPLTYKTNACQKPNCQLGLYCYCYHFEDAMYFEYGEFFRFNLRNFKTQKCFKKTQHQRKTCLYYHNDKDKRRSRNLISYNHVVCSKNQCNNQNCEYSHNKLQQLYHPTRYKTKFCQFYPHQIDKCDYKSFCSFAHTQNQITQNIQLIHLLEKNTQFYINKYKTVWCPFTMNHQRDKCVYAHNFQDYRRNPNQIEYEPIKCQNWKFSDQIKSIEGAGCKAQMACKKCHGWMEHRYHPSIYNLKRNKSIKKQQIDVAENIVNKKLSDLNIPNEYNKQKNKNVTNPQILKNNFSKGTPFFKNDKYSDYSAKTKARTNIIQSDKSIDGSSNKDPIKTNDQKIKPHNNIRLLNLYDDQNLWTHNQKDFKEIQDEQQNQNKSSSRSKSAQKSQQYCATYSNSIKTALGEDDDQILKKLKRQRFNQIQIVNMDSSKIDKLAFLTVEQRVRLTKKLEIYNMKQTNSVSYSKELTRYFISKKKQGILQKMQQKKVKQAKLLKLIQKQINQLSFLEPEQKNCLPKLLKQYVNQKEFKDLNRCIEEETKMK